MSAVVTELPTMQARQHIAGTTMLNLACMGVLRHDAAVRFVGAPGHEVVLLEVWLEQQIDHHPHALPLFAAWQVPDTGGVGNTMQWARQLATGLRAGHDAVVAGSGLETGTRAGEQVLRVIRPTGIRAVSSLERELAQHEAAQHQREPAHAHP